MVPLRVLLVLAVALPAAAVSRVWDDSTGDHLWSTADNWTPSGVPVAGDDVTFNATCAGCPSTIDGNYSVRNMTLDAAYLSTVTANGGTTLTITQNYTGNGGTFAAQAVLFGGATTGNLFCTGNWNLLTGATVTVNKTVTGVTFRLNSGCSLTANVTTTSAVEVVSTASLSSTGNWTSYTLTNNGTVSVGGSEMHIAGSFVLGAAATLNLTGKQLYIEGPNTAHVTCTGNLNTLTGIGDELYVTKSAAANTLFIDAGCNVTGHVNALGRLDIAATASFTGIGPWTSGAITNAGTLNAPTGQTMNVSTFWTNTGTFNHNNGTVNFNVAASSVTVTGTTTFYNLQAQFAVAAVRAINWAVGSTYTVQGTATLSGSTLAKLQLRSTSAGTPVTVDFQGGRTVGYLDVQDTSNPSGISVCVGSESTNSGGNTGFTFGRPSAATSFSCIECTEFNNSAATTCQRQSALSWVK